MNRRNKKTRQNGTFNIQDNRQVYGELMIAGQKSVLRLRDEKFFYTHSIPDQCINGILHDLTKVSLLDCLTPPVPGQLSGVNGTYFHAEVRPHFIVSGDYFIRPHQQVVTGVSIYLDDAMSLFDDVSVIGGVFFDAQPIVKQILSKENLGQQTGPEARVLYHTGKEKIVEARTQFGQITIEHRPQLHCQIGRGGTLKDSVPVSIRFDCPITFQDAMARVAKLVDYLGLLAGRPQNIADLYASVSVDGIAETRLRVDVDPFPGRRSLAEGGKPNSYDVLIDAIRQPAEFAGVLRAWFEREDLLHAARWRFFTCFAKQRYYDIDRLIASANMFDILPPSVVPQDVTLPPHVEAARAACRDRFRCLPDSLERDSVLNCLGRLGKASLKQKIRHRAALLVMNAGAAFSDLIKATDEAVNCRNYYVHGTRRSIDYDRNFGAVIFLTDTLEFVFAASDLIESGWDIGRWMKTGSSMSHPFGRYKVDYRSRMNILLSLLTTANEF